jgi:2,3-bisphosphoglycerate-independent phosphoglycerate mutase
VIDGWGIPSEESPKDGDAIAAADTPVMDELSKSNTGFTELEASSLAVGLPEGLMGNSEVGHLNIGAGRVVWQDVVRIDQAVKKGDFAQNDVIKRTIEAAKNGNGRLHLCGLVSHGGVVSGCPLAAMDHHSLTILQHSKQTHLYALLQAAKDAGVPKVFIHFFGDGRDTDPKSGAGYMEELLGKLKEIGVGQIATVVGRYYAMDRDKRWERVELALRGMVLGEGEQSDDPLKTIKGRYEKGENDEFLKPIIVGGEDSRIKGWWTTLLFLLVGTH